MAESYSGERLEVPVGYDCNASARKVPVIFIPALSELQAGTAVQLLDSLDPDERALSLLWTHLLPRVRILCSFDLHQLWCPRGHCDCFDLCFSRGSRTVPTVVF